MLLQCSLLSIQSFISLTHSPYTWASFDAASVQSKIRTKNYYLTIDTLAHWFTCGCCVAHSRLRIGHLGTSLVWVRFYVVFVKSHSFWKETSLRSRFCKHVSRATTLILLLLSKLTQIAVSHMSTTVLWTTIFICNWKTTRMFGHMTMHDVKPDLLHLFLDLAVILFSLLLKTCLFYEWLILVHTSTDLIWLCHQLFLLFLYFNSKGTERSTHFLRSLINYSSRLQA
jgi:hypothetical protein